MLPYYIFSGLMVVLLAIHYYAKTNKRKFFVLIIILGLLVLFGGFRVNIGPDTLAYIRIFNTINTFGNDYQNSIKDLRYEIGFIYLVSLIKTLGFIQVYSLFSLIIFFNYLLYFNSFKKLTPNFEIALFLLIVLYFFVRDMGILRQAIATSITIFSIIFIVEKKPYLFILFIFFASFFHVSSLVFSPAYFIGNLRIQKHKLFILIAIGLVLSFLPIEFKNQLFLTITGFELPFLNDPNYGTPLSPYTLTFMRRAIPLILIFIFYDKITFKIKYSVKIINLYVFGFFFALIFLDIVIYVSRLASYYLTLEVLIYSYVFWIIKDKTIKFFFSSFILLALFYYISNFMFHGEDMMNPYKNFIFSLMIN
jgi:hypothetical protein